MSDWAELGSRPGLYGWITLGGLLIGGWLWSRKWKETPGSFSIFVGAICGAFLGAKLMFLFAEGWIVIGQDRWLLQWIVGKSIVGALLGGYAGVELVKHWIGHRQATGDWFAVGVPLSIAIGRLGCLSYGCCPGKVCESQTWWTLADDQGTGRWPAVPLELGFNVLFVIAILPIVLRKAGQGQLFHVYLVAYGAFRFWHEFHRDTPKWFADISGYQIGALALIILGCMRGWTRHRSQVRSRQK
ncbi:MAG: prolipoprotein diacylglyceryl transferase [Verrucomicrobiales bacterium]|nr:prolipoprotein diacylglyceryl transferase [Verrucomicrobiales bacterium]